MAQARDVATHGGRFVGKVVLVTGGAGGMGGEQARRVAAEGGFVVVADLQEQAGREIAARLGERGAFVRLDVTEEDDWSRAMAFARERAGAPVNVLLHNAGIARPAPIEGHPIEDFMAVIQVNLVGTFLALRSS